MPRSKVSIQDLRLHLLLEGVDVHDALENPEELTSVALDNELPFNGELFTRSARSRQSAWIRFVRQGTTEDLDALIKFNLSAVLFIHLADRLFAYTWGPAGRFMIDRARTERGFGLKVVLNAVDPARLRSIDVETFEDQTLRTRQQASQQSAMDVFGVDPARDVLNAVAGVPRNQSVANFASGADSLGFSARIEFNELGERCSRFLELFGETTYREHFGWVDNVRLTKDLNTIARLNDALLALLREGRTEHAHLAPPELIEWDDFSGFTYRPHPDEPETMELDLDEYLLAAEDMTSLSLEELATDNVVAHFGEDRLKRWSVFDCLTAEVRESGSLYVLSDGRWFRVSDGFVADIDANVQAIPSPSLLAPIAGVNEKESDYCVRFVESAPGDRVLLDRDMIWIGGGFSQIEVCDVFTRNSQFIHLKRKSASAKLSHLFAQGLASAEAFKASPDFRATVKTKVQAHSYDIGEVVSSDPTQPGQFEVVFGVISRQAAQNWPLSLPFFSRLTLANTDRRLRMLGYRVSAMAISEE